MEKLSQNITIILAASSILLLITLFIVMLVMAYLRRDLKHLKEKETMEADFEKQLLQSQLETQEETKSHFITLVDELPRSHSSTITRSAEVVTTSRSRGARLNEQWIVLIMHLLTS